MGILRSQMEATIDPGGAGVGIGSRIAETSTRRLRRISRQQVGRCESIRLFKRVVTSSKSGLWDEVAVTQIRSLTSPYLRALWPPPKIWKIANFLFSSELSMQNRISLSPVSKIKSDKTVTIPTMSQLSATAAFLRESRRSIESTTTSRCPA
ncbi:hypothetical protein ALC57_05068 [Trachymyrmex cornetzi]|uniref:Uncharacterized protein n=1 Tax=Trachymyrmex cornetzi TaxID=471704 RepID=A0A151JBR0_9HYME|nr:hypothetical protein ALC57_05068 [Trachymyrmex cornetzi]